MSSVESILSQWSRWQASWPLTKAPQILHTFTQGLNHQTFLIGTDQRSDTVQKQAVLKIFKQPDTLEITCQKWMAQQAIAPNIIYADTDLNYVLMDYIEPEQAPLSNDNLTSLANQLNILHSLKVPEFIQQKQPFDLFVYMQEYFKKLPKGHRYFSEIASIHQQVLDQQASYNNLSCALCVCHNDLVKENIIFKQQQTVILDWEYCQANHPEFDLASVLLYLKLDDAQTEYFLNSYFQDSPYQTQAIVALKKQVLWLDILWRLNNITIDDWPEIYQRNNYSSHF